MENSAFARLARPFFFFVHFLVDLDENMSIFFFCPIRSYRFYFQYPHPFWYFGQPSSMSRFVSLETVVEKWLQKRESHFNRTFLLSSTQSFSIDDATKQSYYWLNVVKYLCCTCENNAIKQWYDWLNEENKRAVRATATPRDNYLIGWTSVKRAARAARPLEQFRAVVCKTTTWNYNFCGFDNNLSKQHLWFSVFTSTALLV